MPTLQTLKNNAEAAAAAVAQLKQAYTGHRGLTGEQRALAEGIVARLTALRQRYGTKSAEIDDIIQTISANAAVDADEAAARGEAPDFAALSAELDGLETDIGMDDGAAVVPGQVAQRVQNIEQRPAWRPAGAPRIGVGGNKLSGGFRYSAKKRRRTPSHKKTKVKRTSSKRKSASLRGGRKRTSHKKSHKTSHKKSHKKSHKRRCTSHRRRKH